MDKKSLEDLLSNISRTEIVEILKFLMQAEKRPIIMKLLTQCGSAKIQRLMSLSLKTLEFIERVQRKLLWKLMIISTKTKVIYFGSFVITKIYENLKRGFLFCNKKYKEYPLLFWLIGILLALVLFVLKKGKNVRKYYVTLSQSSSADPIRPSISF